MKVSELIQFLQKVQADHGDIKVVVQCRDDGGEYPMCDEHIYNKVDNWTPKEKCVVL